MCPLLPPLSHQVKGLSIFCLSMCAVLLRCQYILVNKCTCKNWQRQRNFINMLVVSSICAPLESLTGAGVLPVVIYNQLAWYRAETMRLPLAACSDQTTTTVTVVNSVNSNVPSACTADGYLLFQTEEIPPLGYVTYFIVLTSSSDAKATSENLKANQTGFNLFMRKHTHY